MRTQFVDERLNVIDYEAVLAMSIASERRPAEPRVTP